MPISVPSEPKVYTTKYDNFRGVDFTNDPSNVWSHRSPNAKNMSPDLAGRPWKRTGWEVVKEFSDFIDVYNTATGESYEGLVIPQKTGYFELGGEDFLAISNSLGLFFYSRFIGASSAESAYLKFIDGYYGEEGTADANQKTTATIKPDPNRAFFFEGQGKAGFYIFCEKTVNSTSESCLFRFDGDKLRLVTPYIPTLVIAKGPGDSGGTVLQNPNILTLQRIVKFYGDGSSKDFVLPERADTGKAFKVEIMSSGAWSETSAYTTSDYAYAGTTVTKVSFTNAPAAASDGQDNVRVTYSIYGDSVEGTQQLIYTGSMVVTTTVRQTRTVTYQGSKIISTTAWVSDPSTKKDVVTPFSKVVPNIATSNGKPAVDVYTKVDADTWSGTKVGSGAKVTYVAYNNALTIELTPPSGYHADSPKEYSTPSTPDAGISIMDLYTTVTQTRMETQRKTYPIKAVITQNVFGETKTKNAFDSCIRAHVYGDGLTSSVFMTGSTAADYHSRVWWSATADPSYFPDLNYIEAGSNDTGIAGLMKVGEYLGIIKQGQASTDSTIYLAYPTKIATGSIQNGDSVETTYDDTFAIKSSIGGIGAISNGAFNILNGEPLFLSKLGVMGIEPANENEKRVRNRSYFINRRLLSETDLSNAISFVWRNMYILALNNHCYLLDGSQKSSWANEKTNLQYECYYWDNCPVQCFARYNEELWFTDYEGRLCRFKPEMLPSSYHDEYDALIPADSDGKRYIPVNYIVSNPDVKITFDPDQFRDFTGDMTGQYVLTFGSAGYLHRTLFGHNFGNAGNLNLDGDGIDSYLHDSEGWHFEGEVASLSDYGITITEGQPLVNDTITLTIGCPITARWTTVLDDDGSAHYFKTLQKKGTMVALYPQSSTGVKVYLKTDNNAEQYIGSASVRDSNNEIAAPSDFYLKRKAKKYKRLQFIAENDGFDETFGIDEIIKCYTLGNYSRNR